MARDYFETLSDDMRRVRNDISNFTDVIGAEIAYVKHTVDNVNMEVIGVKNDVIGVKNDVYSFKVRFEEFVHDLEKKNNITHAQQQIVILNQELEKSFGLYDKVRKNLLGILQAVDTGLVSKRIITSSTEELMLGTPRYWLSPSLIAISAWINNNETLANRAVSEGLKRNPMKTELIFTLISNRLKKQDASFAWLNKYFETQDPTQMPQETLVLVNAYTDGVFGPDSRGECMSQIAKWMNYLSKQPETIKDLEEGWVKKIKVMQSDEADLIPYKYMQKYTKEFPVLMNLLNYARKHKVFLGYLKGILDAENVKKDYIVQLDDILYKLVNEYDEDEFELRKKHKMCELIVKYEGDKDLAQQDFDANVEALFKNRVTFFDILTNAITQETSSPNLRKLAVLLMKEWIINAHKDFTAEYRMSYLPEITLSIENWEGKTENGSNTEELSTSFRQYLEEILNSNIRKNIVSIWFSIITLVACIIWLIASSGDDVAKTFFVLSLIFGVPNIIRVALNIKKLKKEFEQKCENGASIISATCAEYVDWQKDYKDADEKSEEIPSYLEKFSVDEFASDSSARKILFN